MGQTPFMIASLEDLLDASSRPIYAIDARRQIVYCNAALATWLGLEPARIVGRSVEYHSEPAADALARPASPPPLADLCPPPEALSGNLTTGLIGCVGRGGRLVHRRAEFVPLATDGELPSGLLAFLSATDMLPSEIAAELSEEPTADELHRAIRRFRREQAAEYAIASLLGESAGMRKVRAQVAAAAASQANVLIRGRYGTGRKHVARAIHYRASELAGKETTGRLVPVDCEVATEESLRRAVDSVRDSQDPKVRSTLLLLNLERLRPPLQLQLLPTLVHLSVATRCIATITTGAAAHEWGEPAPDVNLQLLAALSTITIDVPPLAERLDDLPLLAQCFLEAANRGSPKQLGSVRPDALDQLVLYRWPGELEELRSVISAAHAAATTHEITPADLPPIVHHAARAAAAPRRAHEKIVLDELLESIEREVIARALAQAGGNKSAAAELLGMTRPRLYRRLVQLGIVKETEKETLNDAVEDAAP
jgi:transcriptional regulator with AAA-type ATPase domain